MTAPLPPENLPPRAPSGVSPRDIPDTSVPRTTAPGGTGPDATGPDATGPRTPAPGRRRAAGMDDRGHIERTRASALWIGVITAAVLAVLFLVFIAQNSDKVAIKFLMWEGRISLAISLLLSAVIGALVVAVPGVVRITQLRRAVRKNAKNAKNAKDA